MGDNWKSISLTHTYILQYTLIDKSAPLFNRGVQRISLRKYNNCQTERDLLYKCKIPKLRSVRAKNWYSRWVCGCIHMYFVCCAHALLTFLSLHCNSIRLAGNTQPADPIHFAEALIVLISSCICHIVGIVLPSTITSQPTQPYSAYVIAWKFRYRISLWASSYTTVLCQYLWKTSMAWRVKDGLS